ncbi:MAG: glutathione S-transferase C-terminal domain-containing protein, partial [Alphaproteobacteria bacterium]|nr:glutathione S-transferase C-terminal domain-containing protein [Alphaproteobacteria bacterium]
TIIQDTTAIFEYLEARFPTPPALPPGPRQRLAAYLFDLFCSENMKIAWHYRWNFPEQNQRFVTMDFGRSFRPQGSDDELARYGDLIAAQMDGHRANIGITPDMFGVMDEIYFDLLDTLERHFTHHPFLLGGLPSVGDFGLMGPLFAHLARDPYPLHIMQMRSPRVFRWVEHMNTPEIRAPEFFDYPLEYLADDAVPETIVTLLRQFTQDYTPVYREGVALYNDWASRHASLPPGSIISPDGQDQPSLGRITVTLRGHTMTPASQAHSLWVLQRTLNWLKHLDAPARTACRDFAAECGAEELLALNLVRPLSRTRNRLSLG